MAAQPSAAHVFVEPSVPVRGGDPFGLAPREEGIDQRLVELQKSRHAAKQTRANIARITRREELNQWRLARVAARLRNAPR